MNLLQKHKENLIIQRALLLFFYNFNTYPEIVEEMKAENSGFNHAWEEISTKAMEQSKKSGWMATIDFQDIYGLFTTKLTYKAQALLIEKVIDKYYKQAKNDIEFSMEMDARVKEARNKQNKLN